MRNRNAIFDIYVGHTVQAVVAKTPGAAARIAFKNLIRSKNLKHQPRSSEDGGWDGVTINVRKS